MDLAPVYWGRGPDRGASEVEGGGGVEALGTTGVGLGGVGARREGANCS